MTRRGLGVAIATLATLAVSAPAQAAPSLQSYRVQADTGGELQALAGAGFDIHEGRRGNGIEVVGTALQIQKLRAAGLTARATRAAGNRNPLRANAAQAAAGWQVWRPYAREDVALSPAAGNPTDSLMEQLEDLAAEHPRIAKLETIGRSLRGVPIYAMKVTKDARKKKDGSRPAVLFSATQHAREWLAAETSRRTLRLFLDNYGRSGTALGTDGQPVDGVSARELTRLVDKTELWFVIVANPDGYDYTFDPPNRLWRKNLRDNDGDGQITFLDGVDLNRNFPTHWNYDDEGSNTDTSSETFRGTAAASEPETRALDGLMRRVDFTWNKNDHTFGRLLLYPFGWQVDTHAADEPIFTTIAGNDDVPAIPTFDPDLGAELYTTNGDTNDHAYHEYRTISFTPEGTPGTGTGSGFIFQDVEADVQAEFERHVQFSLDLARSEDPSRPESHLGNEVPDFVVDDFAVSYGDPQTVQVNARRDLGKIELKYRIDGGRTRSDDTREWRGGERYGDTGDYWYHRMRGEVRGADPGDEVTVWFESDKKGRRSDSFTYTVASDTRADVLILAAEDYTGISNFPQDPAQTAPKYLSYYEQALADNGVDSDVYDIDANGRTEPHPLGVLSHYDTVIWYTGDDNVTREPGVGANRASRVAHTTQMAVRDFMNEGGKLLYTGKNAGRQYTLAEYPEEGLSPNACDGNLQTSVERCQPLSNDFMQYYLGSYLRSDAGGLRPGGGTWGLLGSDDPFSGFAWMLDGPDSADNQDDGVGIATATHLVTSSLLTPDEYPQFASRGVADWDRPGGAPFDPHEGDFYVHSQGSDRSFKRLTRTIDLTGGPGSFSFWVSYDTEADWDFVFVEARTAGQDDWTTLNDLNGHTTQATGASCSGSSSGQTWFQLHPQMAHYQTAGNPCAPTGTTGVFWGATGNSAGWQEWNMDLSAFAGRQVEVSITYVTDWFTRSLADVLVDEVRVNGELESFETGLGAWTAGAAEGSPVPPNNWFRTPQLFDDAAVTATRDSIYFGFGFEGVSGRENREALMGRVLGHLDGRRR